MAFAGTLTQTGLNITNQPLSFLNLPYLLEIINQSDSGTESHSAPPWLRAPVKKGHYQASDAPNQAQASILSYFDDTDAEPLVRALVTVLSKTKHNEDRILVVLLIRTVANWWKSKETIWERLCGIVDPLAKDDDEAVRMLSIPMTVAPLPVLGTG